MDELMQGGAHTIGRDHVVCTRGRANPPAIRVLPGDLVLADCHDCFGGVIRTSQDDEDLGRIEVGAQGSAPLYPGEFGFMKDDSIGAFAKIAPVENGVTCHRDDVRIPVQPMLGTLGVAPAGGPYPTSTWATTAPTWTTTTSASGIRCTCRCSRPAPCRRSEMPRGDR